MSLIGFSHSFAHNDLLTLYSTNFGYPTPIAHAMGLPITYVSAVLIKLGLHGADAYTTCIALLIIAAYVGALNFLRLIGVSFVIANIMAYAWLSLPIVWGHAAYSSLSMGIALLPTYFWGWLKLVHHTKFTKYGLVRNIASYSFMCAFALFLDGYSFSMFVFGALLLGAAIIGFAVCGMLLNTSRSSDDTNQRSGQIQNIRRLIFYVVPVHILGVIFAYLLYTTYVGQTSYSFAGLDFLRGWGLDLSFIFIPSTGISWIADILGVSRARSEFYYFGDASVWLTTFSIFLLLAGLYFFIKIRKSARLASPLVMLGLLALYMSFGPSLKLNTTKSTQLVQYQIESGTVVRTMPAEYGIMPTGTAWISSTLPGFQSMRASYRWLALCLFAFWAILALATTQTQSRREQYLLLAILVILSLINIPNLKNKFQSNNEFRKMFFQFDKDVVDPLTSVLNKDERVVFLPYGNDFAINYIAGKADLTTYNVGGDKQLYYSMRYWPDVLTSMQTNKVDAFYPGKIAMILASRDVEKVVIPKFNLLLASYAWPQLQEYSDFIRTLPYYSTQLLDDVSAGKTSLVADRRFILQKRIDTLLKELKETPFLIVDEYPYFATVQLNPQYENDSIGGIAYRITKEGYCAPPYSICLNQFDPELTQTQVGQIAHGHLYSTNRRGFLHYGPYSPLMPDVYKLRVRGHVQSASEATWVDVVANGGLTLLGRFSLSVSDKEDILNVERITVPQYLPNVEVRVHLGDGDTVRLDSFSLTPIHDVN